MPLVDTPGKLKCRKEHEAECAGDQIDKTKVTISEYSLAWTIYLRHTLLGL